MEWASGRRSGPVLASMVPVRLPDPATAALRLEGEPVHGPIALKGNMFAATFPVNRFGFPGAFSMDTNTRTAVQLTRRAAALRVLAEKINDEESRDAILQWAADYERLRRALLKWGHSRAALGECQHRLHAEALGRQLSDMAQYRALMAEFQRLICESQAWRDVFAEESDFIKELERITRWRFAQSRQSSGLSGCEPTVSQNGRPETCC